VIREIGFDNEKYLEEQTREILNRVKKFGSKLYLEFGGKLGFDAHAARVLPGYNPQLKIKMLQKLKDKVEVILCIYANDIIQGKVLGDFGITYDHATLKLIDDLKEWGITKVGVVITRSCGNVLEEKFKKKLSKFKIPVYTHRKIKNYPKDVNLIVRENG